jgi:DNA repair exonuclease SbcCD ATPase subunit
MSVLVYETDIGVYLNKNADLKNTPAFKAGDRLITIEIEGVNKLTGQNVLLVQKVADLCWPVVKKEAEATIKALEKADAIPDKAKREKAVKEELDAFNDAVAEKLIKVASGVFTSFAKDKKDYKVYKIKSGIKIAVNGLSLAASIALTAAAGWSGVGTVVGAVGMVRSAASLTQQIVNLSKDSQEIYKRILGNIVKLKQQLSSSSIKANTAKQVGATVLNKVFAVEIESLVVTVSAVEGDFKLMLNKVKGNKVNAVSLSKEIPKLMDQLSDLGKEIAKLEEIEKKTGKGGDKVKKAKDAEKKLESSLDKLLDKVHNIMAGVNSLEEWTVTYHKDIAEISKKYNAKTVKVAGVATDFVLAAGSFVGGNFSDPAQTVKDLHDASKVLVTSLALTNDSLGTLKDLGTSAYDAFKG